MTTQLMHVLEDINGAQIVLYLGAIAAVIVAVAKYGKPLVRVIRRVDRFMSEWYGEEDERDAHGDLVEPGKPSIRARLLRLEKLPERMDGLETKLETVRGQVQNSHGTNLRDDLDTVGDRLDGIESKLSDLGEQSHATAVEVKAHIAIAKAVEARQDRDARRIANALAIRLNDD